MGCFVCLWLNLKLSKLSHSPVLSYKYLLCNLLSKSMYFQKVVKECTFRHMLADCPFKEKLYCDLDVALNFVVTETCNKSIGEFIKE